MQVVTPPKSCKNTCAKPCRYPKTAPCCSDFFLNNAIEVDGTGVSDGKDVVIGIMQHVEQAGIHWRLGCSLPPYSLSEEIQDEIRRQTKAMAYALGVVGLMNVQFAVQDGVVFVLKVPARQPYRPLRL